MKPACNMAALRLKTQSRIRNLTMKLTSAFRKAISSSHTICVASLHNAFYSKSRFHHLILNFMPANMSIAMPQQLPAAPSSSVTPEHLSMTKVCPSISQDSVYWQQAAHVYIKPANQWSLCTPPRDDPAQARQAAITHQHHIHGLSPLLTAPCSLSS
jgi:hypothetical protein